jgi:RNA polymerase sigma factor (sigma-70 family)
VNVSQRKVAVDEELIAELLPLVKSGDGEAFERLYTHMEPTSKALVKRFYVPLHSVEDKDQIARFACWKAARKHDLRDGSFPSYYYTTVRNELAKALRKEKRQEAVNYTDSDFLPRKRTTGEMSTEERYSINEEARHLLEQLRQRMPDKHFRTFELYFMEDLSLRDVATELGLTEGDAKREVEAMRHFVKDFARSKGTNE